MEDPLDKYDIHDVLWNTKNPAWTLPGQEKWVPPDQRDKFPKPSLEEVISQLKVKWWFDSLESLRKLLAVQFYRV